MCGNCSHKYEHRNYVPTAHFSTYTNLSRPSSGNHAEVEADPCCIIPVLHMVHPVVHNPIHLHLLDSPHPHDSKCSGNTQVSSSFLSLNKMRQRKCVVTAVFPNSRLTKGMTPERFCLEKRTLQVLQCNYNALMRWVLWSGEVILITIVVFGLCGSVWAEGFRAVRIFLVAMFSLGLLTTFWKGLGQVYETSGEVLNKWKRIERPPLRVRKFLLATRPVRVEIGSYFYADGSMVLTLLGVITENTFTVLLAT